MENNFTLDEKIELIKQAILKHVPAKYIYLFGSYAYGEPTANSDIDIYAVLPDDVKNDLFLYGDIIGEVSEYKIYDIDLHLHHEHIFNKYRTLSRFEETIYEKGVLLYANP